MDDYTNLKKNVAEYQKKKKKKKDLTYSADDNQFKLDCINNFFNSVSNSKITKNSFKNVLKNDIVNKKQNIIKTNPRGQANEKKTVLDIFKHFAKVFCSSFRMRQWTVWARNTNTWWWTTRYYRHALIKEWTICCTRKAIRKTIIKNTNTRSNA